MCSWLKFTSRVWSWLYWYMICCRDSIRLTGFLSKSFQDPCTRALSRKLAWKQKVCKVLDPHYFWKTTFLPFWDTMTLNMQPELQLMGNLAISRWQLVSKLSRFDPKSPTTPQSQLLQPWTPCATHEQPPYYQPPWDSVCSRTRSYWVQCLAATSRQEFLLFVYFFSFLFFLLL